VRPAPPLPVLLSSSPSLPEDAEQAMKRMPGVVTNRRPRRVCKRSMGRIIHPGPQNMKMDSS
jgi:hypothetical protein